MRQILVDRCWGQNKRGGCPFAKFLSYEAGFSCELTGKDTWQQGPHDPKIEKGADGFPIWCPLQQSSVDILEKYHTDEMNDAEKQERYAYQQGHRLDDRFFNGVKSAHHFTLENQIKKQRRNEPPYHDSIRLV